MLCPAVNSTCNVHEEFECGNGECIDFSRTCDGVVHCKDKSDEKQSYCSKVPPLAALLTHTRSPAPPDTLPKLPAQRITEQFGLEGNKIRGFPFKANKHTWQVPPHSFEKSVPH